MTDKKPGRPAPPAAKHTPAYKLWVTLFGLIGGSFTANIIKVQFIEEILEN